MTDFEKVNKGLETEATKQSIGPNEYHLNTIQTAGSPVYPWAPTARIQKIGGAILDNQKLIDVDSDLLGLTRKSSNDPNNHYKPSEEMVLKYINLEEYKLEGGYKILQQIFFLGKLQNVDFEKMFLQN